MSRPPSRRLGRLLAAQARERDRLSEHLHDARGIMPLLMKRRNGGRWQPEERAVLHRQLKALRHLSPYLLVLALPGSVVALPLLAWWLDRRQALRPDSQPDA